LNRPGLAQILFVATDRNSGVAALWGRPRSSRSWNPASPSAWNRGGHC